MTDDEFYALWQALDPEQRECRERPGDRDRPYRAQPISAQHLGPFTAWEYARLLCLRGLVQDARHGWGRYADDLPPKREALTE